jgi:acylphosphatase
MKKRIHIFYSGKVQGVGFRFTAEETAKRCNVVGWVKNLRDGRVEVMAEAEEQALNHFLEEIRLGPMRNFIKSVEAIWQESLDEFTDFEICYF